MPLPTLSHLPFLIHTLLELPASISFLLNPSATLTIPAPQANALIRQYALLLFSSVLISVIFTFRPIDRTSRNVAGALGIYHVGTAFRAGQRIWDGEKALGGRLGGPGVHLGVHSVCLVGLVGLYLGGRMGRRKGRR